LDYKILVIWDSFIPHWVPERFKLSSFSSSIFEIRAGIVPGAPRIFGAEAIRMGMAARRWLRQE
jgi:hypothetical protein